jgi:parallel beta-helix repeat protein
MATIFVSSSGSNNNPGTEASPYQTYAYAISQAVVGDTIKINRGDTFREPLHCPKSDITITTYGIGAHPIFSGFQDLTGWASLGGGLYEKNNPNFQSNVRVIKLDTNEVFKGRWPKLSAANGGYLTISSASSSSVSNDQISTQGNFVGGSEAVIRSTNYTYDRMPITGKSGSTITWSGSTTYGPYNGFGFYIQNHISFLTELGEWMYSPASKKVTMHFGSGAPTSHTIQGSVIENLVTVASGVTNVSINNIHLSGSNGHAIKLNAGSNFKFNNVEISYAGIDGVNIVGHTGGIFDFCHVHHCNNGGVMAYNASEGTIIRNSRIEDIAMNTGVRQKGVGHGYAVQIPRANSLLENCDITRIGYIGVRFEKKNTKVKRNRISYFCLNTGDGGGIYNWNGGGAQDKQSGLEVTDNIVHHSGPSNVGTPYSQAFQDDLIYIDDHGSGVLISGNTCYAGNGRGIYLHNAETINVYGNLVFDCVTQMLVSSDTTGTNPERIVDLITQNNILFAKTASQTVLHLASNQDDIFNFINDYADGVSGAITELPKTRWDYNTYDNPLDRNKVIRRQIQGASTYYSVDNWKPVYGWDQSSGTGPLTFSSESDNFRLETNETQEAITIPLDKTYLLPDGTAAGASITLQPNEATLLLKQSDINPTPSPDPDPVGPSVQLIAPQDQKAIIYPTTVTLEAEVTVGDNAIEKVEFVVNGSIVGTVTSSPWSFDWVNPTAGVKDIQAIVTDINGLTGSSNFSTLTVYNFIDTEGAFRMFLNVGTDVSEEFNGQTFIGGTKFFPGPFQIDNVQPETTVKIFQTGIAYNILSISIPVPNGKRVTLKTYHNEPWFGVNDGQPAGPGKRVFDIFINGVLVFDNFDIYVYNNNQNTILTFENIEVTDGIIELYMVASVNNANLSALEVIPYIEQTINQAPQAASTSNVSTGTVPLIVEFNGAGSTDDIGIVSYLWDFGDGSTSTEINPIHIYETVGPYQPALTVTDGEGLTDTNTLSITVQEPAIVAPTVHITSPIAFSVIKEGNISVVVNIDDPSAQVSKVYLYLNNEWVDELEVDPYETILPLTEGNYQLKAITYDSNDVLLTESETINFNVVTSSQPASSIRVRGRYVVKTRS